MTTAIIIDDERLARNELRNLLRQHSAIEIIGEASNAAEAISLIDSQRPDLIFLDIQMPGKTGFKILEDIKFIPQVIFVTAYDEYALRAFEVNALDYLLKPVDPKRLAEAISKTGKGEKKNKGASSLTSGKLGKNDHIFIKDGERCWFIKLRDIVLFESVGNYSRVYFENFKPLILSTLASLEKRLDGDLFFRANRRQIVNISLIRKMEPISEGRLEVELTTGKVIEMSRRQSAIFREIKSF